MTSTVPARGQLTDLLVQFLKDAQEITDANVVIGDGDPPAEAGWTGGNPGAGTFVGSITVRTGPAQPADRDGANSRHASWTCQYALRSIGVVRQQADATADLARKTVVGFKGIELLMNDVTWKVQDAYFVALGGVNKVGTGDSATYEVEDVVQVRIARDRS